MTSGVWIGPSSSHKTYGNLKSWKLRLDRNWKSVLLLLESKEPVSLSLTGPWKPPSFCPRLGLSFRVSPALSIYTHMYIIYIVYIFQTSHHTASSTQNIPPLFSPGCLLPPDFLYIFKCNRRSSSETRSGAIAVENGAYAIRRAAIGGTSLTVDKLEKKKSRTSNSCVSRVRAACHALL